MKKFSYYFAAGFFVTLCITKLLMAFIVVLFSTLLLHLFASVFRSRLFAIVIYILVVFGVFWALFYSGREAMRAFPEVADRSFPAILDWTTQHGIDLPFSDRVGFNAQIIRSIRADFESVAISTGHFTRGFVSIVLALVISVGIFLTPLIDLRKGAHGPMQDPYSLACVEIAARFQSLFRSFRRIMGVQIIIAGINTCFTAILIFSIGLPYKFLLIIATFIFGIIPLIGNILSNSVIVCVAATLTIEKAFIALIFLVVIHKLEYFLNSRIIGGRIENPMWLTLASLILGEYILGVSGVIIAPVLLHYVKSEASSVN